eukprot:scaffold1658_cov393-Prasinococcus_capsulatus_cf.AAC.14
MGHDLISRRCRLIDTVATVTPVLRELGPRPPSGPRRSAHFRGMDPRQTRPSPSRRVTKRIISKIRWDRRRYGAGSADVASHGVCERVVALEVPRGFRRPLR